MTKPSLLVKQLTVSKQNTYLNSQFLVFLNNELINKNFLINTANTAKKVQKIVYNNSITTGQFVEKTNTFPLKAQYLESFSQINTQVINQYLNLITVKYANLFIQSTKLNSSLYLFNYVYNYFRLNINIITKLFLLKECVLL